MKLRSSGAGQSERNVLEESVGLKFKGLGPVAKSATSSVGRHGVVII